MIINRVTVTNYMCYYEENTFSFSKGLNIILGENGEGKTKLFEAIEWLFNGGKTDLNLFISAKKLHEMAVDEKAEVSVSLSAERYGEKYHVSRKFDVIKLADGNCTVSNPSITGIEENKKGERSQVDGERLLNHIFPSQIRRYSLFKGESELNIFENDEVLIELVNMFADAKYYDKYSKIGTYLFNAANKAVSDSTKQNSANKKKYEVLESGISKIQREISSAEEVRDSFGGQIEKLKNDIADAAKYVENGQELEIINKRIERIGKKISENQARIDERYTTNLFDDEWVLMHFESIFNEFESKVVGFGKEKRKMQKAFDQEIGMKLGAIKATADLLANEMPLPLNVPTKEIMEELVRDKLCKVCNREAPEGSEALAFMRKRLEEYLESQKPTEIEEEESLFSSDYYNELRRILNVHNDELIDLRKINGNIQDLFEFNQTQTDRVDSLKVDLKKEEQERINILGKSSKGEDRLISVLKNYNGWQADLNAKNGSHLDSNAEIKKLKEELKTKTEEKDGLDKVNANNYLVKTRSIINDIRQIFTDTKEEKFNEFILVLEQLSNDYFKKVNKGAFTGNIKFSKRNHGEKMRLDVTLMEEDRRLHSPNQSLETSMHISVLFAISKLAQDNSEEGFPLIMDAPTSSFGETKTGEFLNIISGTDNQIIVMLKDYLKTDESTKTITIKPEFYSNIKKDKAFWVKLQRPFDRNSLKTINTEVIEL